MVPARDTRAVANRAVADCAEADRTVADRAASDLAAIESPLPGSQPVGSTDLLQLLVRFEPLCFERFKPRGDIGLPA